MARKQKDYFELGNHNYYVDIDAIVNMIRIESQPSEEFMEYVLSLDESKTDETKEETKEETKDKENLEELENYPEFEEPLYTLDVIKLDFIKMMLDTVLNTETKDSKLDFERETSMGFKLSFNTLLKNDIIKED
jgi:hypothetical protein